jgi:HD-like signal output (HDOD) protein
MTASAPDHTRSTLLGRTGTEPVEIRAEQALGFVRELAGLVSGKQIELPSYPEAALRVQRTLGDPHADCERIARVVASEAVLAARVIGMANSFALNPTGSRVTDLRSAVLRVGSDALRSATFAFAVSQLRKAAAYRKLEAPLRALWKESTAMAAAAAVLARRLRRVPADTAMLAGLLSGVGKLYILTRAEKYPLLFGDASVFDAVVRDWHPSVARSILESWDMPEPVVDAVADYVAAHDEARNRVTLADFVAVAAVLTHGSDAPELLPAQLAADQAAIRLGINADNFSGLLQEISVEIDSLRAAVFEPR